MTAEEVVKACCAAWAARELEPTLAWLGQDCVYEIHVPTEVLHFAGRHEGKAAVRKCLAALLEDYGFLAYALDWLTSTGNVVHSQIVYYYTHIDSGQQIDGRFRLVWRVENDRIVQIDEYHDVALLKSFLEMATGTGTT